MLDRKMEDYDASMELLEDKKKRTMGYFLIFYIVGLLIGLCPILSFGTSSFLVIHFSIVAIGAGIAFLIIATWFLLIYMQYEFYLFLVHKKVVKATNKRGK